MESSFTGQQLLILRMFMMQRKSYSFAFPYYYLRYGKDAFNSIDITVTSGIYNSKLQRIAECPGGGFMFKDSTEAFQFFHTVNEIINPCGTRVNYNRRDCVIAAITQYLDTYHGN